eukprot:5512851-Prymnesium_polylepis.1
MAHLRQRQLLELVRVESALEDARTLLQHQPHEPVVAHSLRARALHIACDAPRACGQGAALASRLRVTARVGVGARARRRLGRSIRARVGVTVRDERSGTRVRRLWIAVLLD